MMIQAAGVAVPAVAPTAPAGLQPQAAGGPLCVRLHERLHASAAIVLDHDPADGLRQAPAGLLVDHTVCYLRLLLLWQALLQAGLVPAAAAWEWPRYQQEGARVLLPRGGEGVGGGCHLTGRLEEDGLTRGDGHQLSTWRSACKHPHAWAVTWCEL